MRSVSGRYPSHRGLLALGVLVVFLVLACCGGIARASSVGSPAPDFSGTTLDGQKVSLATYHGKPLVLLFWGSW